LALGFTINTLTMFGMVLAIGLLVDDAIVVVENVERVMEEDGSSPKEATRKSMAQITGALVGIALVLSAVFVPMAFFGGATGVIYRQFSVTIVSAMALSVLVALIFTPALCATILKTYQGTIITTKKASSAGSTAISIAVPTSTSAASRVSLGASGPVPDRIRWGWWWRWRFMFRRCPQPSCRTKIRER
jgi:multidrug efflux pump subunit AcrB